jgi:integrase
MKSLYNVSGPYKKAYECWQAEAISARSTTRERYLNTIKSLAQFLNSKPIGEISKKDISEFCIHLIETGNSPVTSKQKVGILKTIFNSAINHELIDKNPIEHFKLPYKRPHKPRVGFTLTDLELIFSSPIYTQGYLPLGGGKIACYWLPLLALFTGARLEELAQLQVSDIQKAKDLGYYLTITDLGDTGAQLKNSHSRRNIPIHPVLIACGFMEHVKNRERGYLFPDLKINPRGKRSGYFSYFFSHYLRQKILITDERKVFHSFRHTFKDICRQCGIEEAVHDALTGHGKTTAGRNYGNEQYPLEPLFDAMSTFTVKELDLSHLLIRPVSNQLNRASIKPISAFYGLVMAFSGHTSRRDTKPFLLAIHDGRDAALDINTLELAYRQLPDQKLLLAKAWIELHREELIASWQLGKATGDYFKIAPLQ